MIYIFDRGSIFVDAATVAPRRFLILVDHVGQGRV